MRQACKASIHQCRKPSLDFLDSFRAYYVLLQLCSMVILPMVVKCSEQPASLQGYRRVVLVGHSYGCYLVNRLASEADARHKVAALVLIGAGYPVPGYERLRWIFYLPLFVSATALALLSVSQLCIVTACIQGGSRAEWICKPHKSGCSTLLCLWKDHKSSDFRNAVPRTNIPLALLSSNACAFIG
jgi:hypothetical protein